MRSDNNTKCDVPNPSLGGSLPSTNNRRKECGKGEAMSGKKNSCHFFYAMKSLTFPNFCSLCPALPCPTLHHKNNIISISWLLQRPVSIQPLTPLKSHCALHICTHQIFFVYINALASCLCISPNRPDASILAQTAPAREENPLSPWILQSALPLP